MLTIYRRHTQRCPHREEGRKYRRCRCPIWVDGFLSGKEIRKSLDLRSWEKAQAFVRDWEAQQSLPDDSGPVRIDAATEDFLSDAGRRKLSRSTVSKYNLLFRELLAFADNRGFRFLEELDLPTTRKFCGGWTQDNNTALKKLERLRAFFRYSVESKWLEKNPARKIQNPQVKQTPTMPYTPEETMKILRACDRYKGDWRRLKAFVFLLRYSGLRIGDAARLRKDRIESNKLMLYVQKTGVPVCVPLPDGVIEALNSFEHANQTYFFWSGTSDPDGIARTWMKYLHSLFQLAGIKGGHAHRFRDTFAVELLLKGVPIERVSVLLGHSSVKITERHYAPWVRARQEQLEADVKRTWGEDPILFSETKGTSEVHGKIRVQ